MQMRPAIWYGGGYACASLICDLVHRAGFKQQAADALSCLTITGENQASVEDDLPVAVLGNATESKAAVQFILHMIVI